MSQDDLNYLMASGKGSNCSFWKYDDITRCTRDRLDSVYPLVLGIVSIAILVVKSILSWRRHKKNKSIELKGENRPLLAVSDVYGSINLENGLINKSGGLQESIKDRHFDLKRLSDTNEDGTPYGIVQEVYKSMGDRVRVVFEFLLVLVEFGMAVSAWFIKSFQKEYSHTPILLIRTVFWGYLLFLVSSRLINLTKVKIRLPSLWVHSTFLYFFNFFPALLTFRSTLIDHVPNETIRLFYQIHFAISLTLLLLNFTAKVGDKPSKLYVTSDGATPSPENISSILSFITYSWIDKMVRKAYKAPLTKDDIWGLRQDDYALSILKSFEAGKSASKFTFRLFSHFKYLLAIQAFWAALDSCLVFAPSLLLKKILEFVENPNSIPVNLAWTLVIMMPMFKLVDSISSGCSLFIGRRVCIRMKAIIIGEVYAKALRRKVTTQSDDKPEEDEEYEGKVISENKEEPKHESKELGAIINLMAIDAFKVSEICGYLHYFVSSFLMIFICIVLLYKLLGISAIIGAIAIVLLFPINFKLANLISHFQKDMLAVTDKRIQKLNETFQSIRIIKFFAWEEKFLEIIMKIRNDELYILKLSTLVWCCAAFVWFITPTLITLISFYYFTIVEGHTLTAPIAFTALSLFTLLRAPLDQLSDMTSFVIQSKVSLDRIGEFLDEDETYKYDQLSGPRDANSPYIGFEGASFSWNSKSSNDFKLRDLNVEFKSGKLNVIIGATGSGKTSLLMALLGEMELLEGKVFLPGIIPRDELVIDPQTGLTESVAYCSQTPWLLNDTIRNNILFFSPFNQERYDKVVEACALLRDFEILSGGDSTEIGEKGITLSGGQKQRVSLARAIYSNSKHVLLDDCLSAVDSHTASWIYENCISAPIMQGRTCILVSHNVALTVQSAEWVISMHNGRIKNQGTPEDLLKAGDLGDDDLVKSSVINSRTQSSSNLESLDNKNADLKAKAAVIDAKLKAIKDNAESNDPEPIIKTDGKLVEEEGKASGVVGKKVYLGYAKDLGGVWALIGIIFACCVAQFVFMFQSWWLRYWTLQNEKLVERYVSQNFINTLSNIYDGTNIKQLPITRMFTGASNLISFSIDYIGEAKSKHTTLYYIIIYALIGFGFAILACLRHFITFLAGLRASNIIFRRVLKNVLGAKLRFFDKTPQGRIMNRFSKDIESVDQELTPFASGVSDCVIQCISILILIAAITPGFLFFAFIIAFMYYFVGIYYLSLSRELKRYESITKSPIHQHFSESLHGVSTIRAYGVESRFMRQNLTAINNNNRPFFYLWVSNRWLSFRVDAVGSLVMFFAGIFVLLSVGKIDAGLAGLSLSYAIAFSEAALWIVRLYANVEMNMNSVERLQEYFEIEQEPPYEIPETKPRASWPDRGEIIVKDVSLRYSPELPRVIKNVSFDVEPNNKIGIVGRTGAGKSTIITAFFRFLDPETGSILIDGVDITKIGLRDLRQGITIIPQDPTLFLGTIRSNLDPFGQYNDEQMFKALRRVNLINDDQIEEGENQNVFMNLDSKIAEGGGNLSQGERQLVCLSRSLLKNPKVMLLDEATSSIDYKSDSIIQQTIREEFSNSTILTIAHRLRTIIDYDKILVMDAGRVVEYDNPYVLISDKKSLFYSMCVNSGELDSLVKLAKEAFVKKKNQKS
ncbi:uncharacterized protein PRCAT00002351001 [Priceomyces carsonii]|uniref:uncharacterized protein n=1 Tax=Priceomyces carsonii TaxID=28549 RepID=UPI002EDB5375|nr:unnamed protein product [Priceomyces carsonii]